MQPGFPGVRENLKRQEEGKDIRSAARLGKRPGGFQRGVRVKGDGHFPVQFSLRLTAIQQKQRQNLTNGTVGFRQPPRLLPAGFQGSHGIRIVFCLTISGKHFRNKGRVTVQNQSGSLRAAQLQTQFHKIPIIVGQPGKLPAGFAQGVFSQLRLNPAQSVLPPHGTASVGDCQIEFAIFLPEYAPQVIAQCPGKLTIAGGRCTIHLHLPFLAAAVGATPGKAAKCVKIVRFCYVHKNSPKERSAYSRYALQRLFIGTDGAHDGGSVLQRLFAGTDCHL